MHRLHLSRFSDLDAADVPNAKEGDLVLRWFESSVSVQHMLAKAKDVDMSREAEEHNAPLESVAVDAALSR
uniref:Uncharacterized protein n=1 Tax=Tanacetum cinerariifolium TaxID=118510 RepID=A0A699RHY4_TANCI|nr:hypothetical protein [Tanacetum cinerariifolium]